jgi:hypothetical protein
VFEASKPRLAGRNAIRFAPDKYRDSQMSWFFPFIGQPMLLDGHRVLRRLYF